MLHNFTLKQFSIVNLTADLSLDPIKMELQAPDLPSQMKQSKKKK